MDERDQELTALEKQMQRRISDQEQEIENLLNAWKNEQEINKQNAVRLDMCREIYRDVFTVIIKTLYLHRNQ